MLQSPVPERAARAQRFANVVVHHRDTEASLEQTAGPSPRGSDPVVPGKARESAFLTRSQAMRVVRGLPLGNHCPRALCRPGQACWPCPPVRGQGLSPVSGRTRGRRTPGVSPWRGLESLGNTKGWALLRSQSPRDTGTQGVLGGDIRGHSVTGVCIWPCPRGMWGVCALNKPT